MFVPRATACLFALLPALAGAKDSATLWRQSPPPFEVYDEGLAGPGGNGRATRPLADAGQWQWYLPPVQPDEARNRALAVAARHTAERLRRLGLRAPVLTIREDHYPLYLVKSLGSAAAHYGPGYREFSDVERERLETDDWDWAVVVGEDGAFGKDFGIYPEKGALSIGHELFHGIQRAYPVWSTHARGQRHEGQWVTEALPDALGLWTIKDLSIWGSPPFDWRRRFASGSQRFGKVLGMRPYDYPLDVRTAPTRMEIYPQGVRPDQRALMTSYMSSSFWRYVFEDSLPGDRAWRPLVPALDDGPVAGAARNLREESTLWADRSLRRHHPVWRRGLYDALPAFIAWWVQFPDEVMRSRRGEFAHARWIGHAFSDGCPLFELNESKPSVKLDVSIRYLAARCIRVKWTGATMGRSGWPAASLSVAYRNPLDSQPGQAQDARRATKALEDFHLGVHGVNLGKPQAIPDPATGKPNLLWTGLALDPLNGVSTNGETVLTFTNVAREPLKTSAFGYDIVIGMASATSQGKLVKPAEPAENKPASTVTVASRRRPLPALAPNVAQGESMSVQVTPSPLAARDDCLNATAKIAGGGAQAGAPSKRTSVSSELAGICLGMTAGASREDIQPPREPEVKLDLPHVPIGHTGPIDGARARVAWRDPALGRNDYVSARTRDVQLDIRESTAGTVSGTYRARFDAKKHDVEGEVSGDFSVWRAVSDERLPPEDPLDLVSSEMMQMVAKTGGSPDELRERMARNLPTARRQRPASTAVAAPGPCPLDCDAFRAGQVSDACRITFADTYAACPEGGVTARADIEALTGWMMRDMPEPQRSTMVRDTVDSVMRMPPAVREEWVQRLRRKKAAQGD